jgi:YcxB-like protein
LVTIETKFTITQPEYVRAMRRHNKTRIQPVRDILASIAAILAGTYLLLYSETRFWAYVLVVPSIILLFMIGYVKFIIPSKIYQASKRKLSSEYWMQFGEDGMRFRYSDIDASLKWSVFSSWLRDNEFYILYHDGIGCSVIPRRAFCDGDDERFSKLLASVLGPPETE